MTALTDRQLEIIVRLCNGLTLEEIGEELYLSLSTVKNHLAAARKKAGARTNPHLVSIVIASDQLYWSPAGERTLQEPQHVD